MQPHYNNNIESTKSVKLLGITNDDRLRFDQNISNLCPKAAMQLNALGRLQKYMRKSEKVTIVNSFIYRNFNYCPLVWHFSTCESIRKIEKIEKCCLRIEFDDYDSDYDVLLRKSGKVTMEIKWLRVLAFEIFKTVNNLNPNYKKVIFTPKLHPKVGPNDILVKHHNTIKYGTKSLKTLGSKIWNQLHYFFNKQPIFDPRPENCLSFSKKSSQKIVYQLFRRWSINFYCLNIQTSWTPP